jgi:hypothetical protein
MSVHPALRELRWQLRIRAGGRASRRGSTERWARGARRAPPVGVRARLPRCAQEPVARAGRARSCCARCSTSPTTGSRRSSGRATRTPASSSRGPAATCRSGAPVRVLARAAGAARDSFLAATEEGDLAGLEKLLAYEVSLHANGGGKAPAIARALHGRARVRLGAAAGVAPKSSPRDEAAEAGAATTQASDWRARHPAGTCLACVSRDHDHARRRAPRGRDPLLHGESFTGEFRSAGRQQHSAIRSALAQPLPGGKHVVCCIVSKAEADQRIFRPHEACALDDDRASRHQRRHFRLVPRMRERGPSDASPAMPCRPRPGAERAEGRHRARPFSAKTRSHVRASRCSRPIRIAGPGEPSARGSTVSGPCPWDRSVAPV